MPVKQKPLCSHCVHCVQDVERPVPRFFRKPIFYPGFFCGNKLYEMTDYVFGETAMPWCEELNDKGQCPSFEIRPAEIPQIEFDPETNTVAILCQDKVFFSFDGETFEEYIEPFVITETKTVSAYSVFGTKIVDGEEVENKSEVVTKTCEWQDNSEPEPTPDPTPDPEPDPEPEPEPTPDPNEPTDPDEP